jgi:thiol:disulfide interchange protein
VHEELLDQGKLVLAVHYAEWSLTSSLCVRTGPLTNPSANRLMKEATIVPLYTDHTSFSHEAQEAVQAVGRIVVPMTALYFPGERPAHLFPELLREPDFSKALKEIIARTE